MQLILLFTLLHAIRYDYFLNWKSTLEEVIMLCGPEYAVGKIIVVECVISTVCNVVLQKKISYLAVVGPLQTANVIVIIFDLNKLKLWY